MLCNSHATVCASKIEKTVEESVDYNSQSAESIAFFKMVQNKLHYAAHGHGKLCCCKKNTANPKLAFRLADICLRKRVLHVGVRGGHAIFCQGACDCDCRAICVLLQVHNRGDV